MNFDFESYLKDVARSVSALERGGRPVRAVTLERSYRTSSEDLWDAVTNPDRLPRWFLPVSGELNLGGRYQFEGNAGGVITECEPPHWIAATWEFAGEMSWIEVRIADEGSEHSRLSLSHICPLDDHWRTYGPGAAGVGWELGLIGLEVHLSSSSAERLDEEALAASEQGKAFIAASSLEWGRAAAVAGEDPKQAEAAAQQTTTFYLGEDVKES